MKCTRCNNPLERDEKRGCSFCPICHPPKTAAPAVVEPEKKKVHPLNVNVTEERVREICREVIDTQLANGVICNCKTLTTEGLVGARDKNDVLAEIAEKTKAPNWDKEDKIEIGDNVPEEVAKSWREIAKSLDIPLFQRTKKEVLAEIAEKTKTPE